MDKIISLIDRLERVKLTQDMEPEPEPVGAGAELAALDEAGIAAEAEALGITPNDVREMARIYSR